jgi:hypothetical protein
MTLNSRNEFSMKTLSVVAPNGIRIANGEKTLEIRKWRPEGPLSDLLIVENQRPLIGSLTEEIGNAVCIVDVVGYHDWERTELQLACGSYWEPGWIAWELANVRHITPFSAMAKKRIYETRMDAQQDDTGRLRRP